jgi:NADH-quinone oxidoreductase subunit C
VVADGAQAAVALRERFPEAVVSSGDYRDQHWIQLRPERLLEICEWLRDDPATGFDFLVDVTAVHWPGDPEPLELVYHLYSYPRNDRLRVKLRTGDGGAVPSLTGLWRSADWNEREAFDMFGIRFDGHPDLRRILMPEDYTDHPLRKEFPLFRG